jgi:hypothetical protein
MGSKTEDHRRIYTGQLRGAEISFVMQDSMGNPPVEFSANRKALQ